MAYNTNISIAGAKAALNALVDRMDTGTGANPKLTIYDNTAAQPNSCDDAVPTGSVALATISWATGTTATVFGAAGTTGNSAVATAAGGTKTETSAPAAGTAAWFRAVNRGGTAIIDGSVGTATADLILDTVTITTGQEVKVTSWKVKLNKGV